MHACMHVTRRARQPQLTGKKTLVRKIFTLGEICTPSMSDAITMSVRMQMASLAAKMGPRELGATGGLLAAVTLYWAGAPIQEVQALEKKPYPEHVPGKTAKLHRRPSWEAKFTGSEEQGRAFATASTVFDAAAKTRLHRRPSWEGKFERHDTPTLVRTHDSNQHHGERAHPQQHYRPIRYTIQELEKRLALSINNIGTQQSGVATP